MKTVNIVDAICGKGKSTALINYMNDNKNDNKKFLYITPFLSEVERIKKSCPFRNFKSPENRGAKIYDVKRLISKGYNIVATHSLFKMFDKETIDLTMLNDYTLIMDEVANVVEVSDISKYDLDTLLEKYVEVGDKGKLKWIADEYEGEFEEYKKQCELDSLYLYCSSSKLRPIMLWLFPISVFEAFKEVFVLTYLFQSQIQKYYYDYYGFDYKYWYIKDYNLTEEHQEYDLSIYKDLIRICDNENMNKIGNYDTSLSVGWYERNKNNENMNVLKRNCSNFFKNITKTPSSQNMWTTFRNYRKIVKGKGYTKGFVSISTRATNEYNDKESIAYLCNRYINPIIKNFFIKNGIEIDENGYSLSELLQFIFRSRIRNEESINLYIPSLRMRSLLENWIKENGK